MDYHKRLKELRVKNNYTQAEIAYILQTRQEQYSKYESGKRDLPIKHLVTLCYLYKVSSDYILGIKEFNREKHC
ncbi:MAG: helix-turn-helix transcriptional regulator [Ruminococcus sp.]|nr:helix-turn-helix transcriptional regulator [Ruminococcus sp.]